mmetsp:Transcript_16024/g.46092  ORF Transcript_16024/g.46092 Transcript_16024/m.46092 type:complete len:478 (-) Transcript_16024:277-1710(-)
MAFLSLRSEALPSAVSGVCACSSSAPPLISVSGAFVKVVLTAAFFGGGLPSRVLTKVSLALLFFLLLLVESSASASPLPPPTPLSQARLGGEGLTNTEEDEPEEPGLASSASTVFSVSSPSTTTAPLKFRFLSSSALAFSSFSLRSGSASAAAAASSSAILRAAAASLSILAFSSTGLYAPFWLVIPAVGITQGSSLRTVLSSTTIIILASGVSSPWDGGPFPPPPLASVPRTMARISSLLGEFLEERPDPLPILGDFFLVSAAAVDLVVARLVAADVAPFSSAEASSGGGVTLPDPPELGPAASMEMTSGCFAALTLVLGLGVRAAFGFAFGFALALDPPPPPAEKKKLFSVFIRTAGSFLGFRFPFFGVFFPAVPSTSASPALLPALAPSPPLTPWVLLVFLDLFFFETAAAAPDFGAGCLLTTPPPPPDPDATPPAAASGPDGSSRTTTAGAAAVRLGAGAVLAGADAEARSIG